jgi:hypothetical protein
LQTKIKPAGHRLNVPRERPGRRLGLSLSLGLDLVVESPSGETVEAARGVRQGVSAARSRKETMANKDKGGAKDKKAASKTLKEKREAKRAKGKGSDRSSSSGR